MHVQCTVHHYISSRHSLLEMFTQPTSEKIHSKSLLHDDQCNSTQTMATHLLQLLSLFLLQSYASKGNDNYQLCATFSFDQYAMHFYSLHLYFAWKLSQVGVLIYFQIPIRRWQITCCVFLCTLELWSYKKPMNVHNTHSLTTALWTTVRTVLMILDDGF